MCGILLSNEIQTESDFERKLNLLSHRGPDAISFVSLNKWRIGHVRLSIIDKSERSNQPFRYKNLIISFNGEIYNFLEIRAKLESLGHHFRTDSDTEVVLLSYFQWGKKSLEFLYGMFAFAILNVDDESVFACRDRIGQKPFYYSCADSNLTISSELRTFDGLKFDKVGLSIYYNAGYVPAPYTVLEGVNKLEPGGMLEFKNGVLKLDKYWCLGSTKHLDHLSLDALIKDSVDKRLISDVPVAVFLSGGLDSSIVAKIANKKELKSYTARFSDSSIDESVQAREQNRNIKTKQEFIEITKESLNEVFLEFIERLDEPFGDSSIIGTMMLCKALPHEIKVILTGDGGDESFFGYNHFKWLQLKLNIEKYSPKIVIRFIAFSFKLLYQITRSRRFLNINLLLSSSLTQFYKYVFTGFTDLTQDGSDDWFEDLIKDIPKNKSPFQTMADINIRLWLEGDGCVKSDRGGMLFGKELRSPFLDHRIIDKARSLHVKERMSKRYLLDFADELGLDTTLFGKKRGFSMPIGDWLEPLVNDSESIFWTFDYTNLPNFDKEHFWFMLNEFASGNFSFKEEIWRVFILISWFEKRST